MSGPMSHQDNCTHAAYKWMDSWEIWRDLHIEHISFVSIFWLYF
jgi:hypothetical protein